MDEDTAGNNVLRRLIRRFGESDCSWLSTVRPDGRAHSTPVWHVWHAGRKQAYVITSPTSVKVANVRENPHVVITHQDPVNPIIIEGRARPAPAVMEELRPLFQTKYDWDPGESAEYSAVLEITPTKLMAWGKFGEGRWSGEDIARGLADVEDGGRA